MDKNRRKMKKLFTLIILIGIFAISPYLLQAGENISISMEDGVIEVNIDYSAFDTEAINVDGKVYSKVALENSGYLNKPGFPMIPAAIALLNVSAEDISGIEVVDAKSQTFSGYKLLPCPSKEVNLIDGNLAAKNVFKEDSVVYGKNSFFPEKLFEPGQSGKMRGNNLSQIIFYPLQFNPVTGEIRFFSKISARVLIKARPTEGASFRKLTEGVAKVYRKSSYRKAGRTLKVSTGEEGIYKITYNDIKKAGFNPKKIKTSTIRLYNKGDEIAVSVIGKKKKYLLKKNYILFYGEANKSEYSDTNVYWLVWGGSAGKRMTVYNGTEIKNTLAAPAYFKEIMHFEKDSEWVQTVPHEEGKDHWMWGSFILGTSTGDGTKNVSFSLDGLYENSADVVTMTVAFLGVTKISGVDTGHHTELYINNNLVDDFLWDGETEKVVTSTFSASYLDPITNTLTVKEIADQGASFDAVHLNWFDISVNKNFIAYDNELKFSYSKSGQYKMSMEGFTKGTVNVFDITDPLSPRIMKIKKQKTSARKYSALFADSISSAKTYLALTKNNFKKPLNVSSDKYSNLAVPGNGADYIIISHSDFIKSAKALANFRKSDGMTVKTVDVQDVYDEFSYGLFDPQAIRDFLKFAYENWNPQPLYVLLIGDANFDYKDLKETGVKNYLPTKLVHTATLGPTPSDNWFVCADDEDELPDMAIGRIPARTKAEIDNAVKKIIKYETSPSSGDWNKNIIFAADENDPGAGDFVATSNKFASLLTVTYTVSKIYLDDYYNSNTKKTDVAAAKKDLIIAMNDGSFMVNYVGHGSADLWASGTGETGSIFSNSAISFLSNSGTLPLILALDCFNGFFASPDVECLAEKIIVEKNNGAVCFIGPSGTGYNLESQIFGEEVYKVLFDDNGEKIGGMIFNEAKKNSFGKISIDNINDIVYFGDPATKLNLPQ